MSHSEYLNLPTIDERKVKELSELTDQICDRFEKGMDCNELVNQFNEAVKQQQEIDNFLVHHSAMTTEMFVKKSLVCGNLPNPDFDDFDLRELIARLKNLDGTELEMFYWCDLLEANVNDPNATDYIFHDNIPTDEVFKKIKSYQMPRLP